MPGTSYSTEFLFPAAILSIGLLVYWKHMNSRTYVPAAESAPEPQQHSDPAAEVTVRVVMPGGQTHTCTLAAGETFLALKQKVFGDSAGSIVLVYMGRRLSDSETLSQYGIRTQAVLHAQRLSADSPSASSAQVETSSPVAFLACSGALLLFWGLLLYYPQLFDSASQVILVALSFVWALFAKNWLFA